MGSGLARFVVEEVSINDEVLLGLTQPQLWSLLLAAIGAGLFVRTSHLRPGEDAANTEPDCIASGS